MVDDSPERRRGGPVARLEHLFRGFADGVFRDDGVFVRLPAVPAKLLELGFRSRVLELLAAEGAVSKGLVSAMLGWRHSGYSVHNAVRVRRDDAPGRMKLAQYMLRAPFSLEKMSYIPETGTVMYRSRMHKSLKRTPGDAGRAMAGNALPPHSGPVRAPGALCRVVFE